METRFSSGRVTGGTKTSAAHVQWIRLLLAGTLTSNRLANRLPYEEASGVQREDVSPKGLESH